MGANHFSGHGGPGRRGLASAVPRVSYFRGIAIYMYWDEGAHSTPHFHAHRAGERASVDFEGRLIAGELDEGALRLVREWATLHADELRANWERARQAESILPIEPLS